MLDSSDLKYVFENEDGSFDIDLAAGYYGEVDYAMKYRTVQGDSFDWLYLDFATLQMYANESGFKCEKVADGSHYDYYSQGNKLYDRRAYLKFSRKLWGKSIHSI